MKEDIEWIRSWTDLSNNDDLPRILLIGDSIVEGYHELVQKALKGICYVDYIATSYPIDRTMYQNLIITFANDSKYDLIHFNHGLHGFEMSIEQYKYYVQAVIDSFNCKNIVMATSTKVNLENNTEEHIGWKKVLKERNDFIKLFALNHNFSINDLNKLSYEIDIKDRAPDGTHYLLSGYKILSNQVVNCIKENLFKLKTSS